MELLFQSVCQPAESTLLSIIDRSYDHRLNFVLAVLKTPREISFSVRRVRAQCTSGPQYFASYGFAFFYFLNPVENNFEGVPFSMPGRACQDIRVTRFNRSYKCAVEQIWYTLMIMDGEMDWGFHFFSCWIPSCTRCGADCISPGNPGSIVDKGLPDLHNEVCLLMKQLGEQATCAIRHSVRSSDVSSLSNWMSSRCLFDMTLVRPQVDADVLLRNRMVLPLRRFGFRGTTVKSLSGSRTDADNDNQSGMIPLSVLFERGFLNIE